MPTEIMVRPAKLIDDEEILFGDSEWYVDDMFEAGELDEDSYRFFRSTAGNPFAKIIVMDIKLAECSESFIASIAEEGVHNPVHWVEDTIVDGHHRLAVAYQLGIEIPVLKFDSWEEWNYQPYKREDLRHDGGQW